MSGMFSEINNHIFCWLRTTQALSLQGFMQFIVGTGYCLSANLNAISFRRSLYEL